MSDTYQGAQDQGSTATDYNAIDFIIDQKLARISTAIPVKIIKAPYDKQGNPIAPGAVVPIGYVDVQPMVNQLDGFGKAMPHATVYHLSYHRYQGGSGAFITDPAKDDIGHMVVADRDTSSVRATDAVANPGSKRRFDKADGVFFGSPQAKAPTQWFTFTADGFEIHDKHANKIVTTADGLTITDKSGNIIDMKSGLIKLTGNVEITGTLKVDGTTTVQDINIQGTETGGGIC